jgi:Ni2+-binding GTPase involved in maturation of urease and hydrogenase
MKLVTVSGPPSSGKTSVLLRVIEELKEHHTALGVVKFDCLSTHDKALYEKKNIPVKVGISGNLCPDHFFVTNIEACYEWGRESGFEYLFTESAGLCNRCSPHIKNIIAVCVIDCLSGIYTPHKIGPMLKLADVVIITKGDIVSQAEREVFAFKVRQSNPKAQIIFINGNTGQGAFQAAKLLQNLSSEDEVHENRLRFSMPAAICSYCLGETKIGSDYQMGNVKKMHLEVENKKENIKKQMDDEEAREEGVYGNLHKIQSLSIIGGVDKKGEDEQIQLSIEPGDIISIVGPTGSGKSRLLADIECMAQKDTPTKRQIYINGEVPDGEVRFSIESKLVAQISQNMNFIMDLTVEEFIKIHAKSRMIEGINQVAEKVFQKANELSGEPFDKNTPVTALSGGQSRALMIADTALISASPIVLIDEIENAGVDRKKALDLLVNEEKIVLMSTHDPILALMGHKRIIIKNGGILKVIETTEEEKNNLVFIQLIDDKMMVLRNKLRRGESLNSDIKKTFSIE